MYGLEGHGSVGVNSRIVRAHSALGCECAILAAAGTEHRSRNYDNYALNREQHP